MIRKVLRRPILEWSSGAFLALTMLSYPFFLKFLFHSAYQFLVFLTFATVLLMTISWGKLRIPSTPRMHLIAVFLGSYVLYLAILSIASFLNAAGGYSLAPLSRVFMKFALGLALLTQVRWEFHRRLLSRYVDLMTLTAAMALILMPLALFGLIQPIFNLELTTASGSGSLRSVYPFGMTWGGIWLGGGRILARLQSFADEPGTYAFALLPAIAWATARHRWKSLAILLLALLGTLSAGAIPLGAAIVAVLVWRHVNGGRKYVLGGLALALLLIPLIFVLPQTSYLAYYLTTKIGGGSQSVTSLGQRIGDLRAALEILAESPWGLGAGSLGTVFKVPIGIGFGVVLGDAGILGLALYLVSSLALGAMAFRLLFFCPMETSAIGAAMLSLWIGAMQRAQWDESFWHWWIVALTLFAFGRIKRTRQ